MGEARVWPQPLPWRRLVANPLVSWRWIDGWGEWRRQTFLSWTFAPRCTSGDLKGCTITWISFVRLNHNRPLALSAIFDETCTRECLSLVESRAQRVHFPLLYNIKDGGLWCHVETIYAVGAIRLILEDEQPCTLRYEEHWHKVVLFIKCTF